MVAAVAPCTCTVSHSCSAQVPEVAIHQLGAAADGQGDIAAAAAAAAAAVVAGVQETSVLALVLRLAYAAAVVASLASEAVEVAAVVEVTAEAAADLSKTAAAAARLCCAFGVAASASVDASASDPEEPHPAKMRRAQLLSSAHQRNQTIAAYMYMFAAAMPQMNKQRH